MVTVDEMHFMDNLIVFDDIGQLLKKVREKVNDPETLEEINQAIKLATEGADEAWRLYEETITEEPNQEARENPNAKR